MIYLYSYDANKKTISLFISKRDILQLNCFAPLNSKETQLKVFIYVSISWQNPADVTAGATKQSIPCWALRGNNYLIYTIYMYNHVHYKHIHESSIAISNCSR